MLARKNSITRERVSPGEVVGIRHSANIVSGFAAKHAVKFRSPRLDNRQRRSFWRLQSEVLVNDSMDYDNGYRKPGFILV